MKKPVLLDLFCCQGGASRGYADAGFDVIGVDLDPQPRYPFPFLQMDALTVLDAMIPGPRFLPFWHSGEQRVVDLRSVRAIHASPPCQAHTLAQRIQGNEHPDLVAPTRERLEALGLPYIIENVPGAPLLDPIELCGSMFGLETYRHRLFESNVDLTAPEHPDHVARTTKMGRAPREGEYMHVVGNFSGVERARGIMGMDWANRDGLREAIPPAYTEFLGKQLIEKIQ